MSNYGSRDDGTEKANNTHGNSDVGFVGGHGNSFSKSRGSVNRGDYIDDVSITSDGDDLDDRAALLAPSGGPAKGSLSAPPPDRFFAAYIIFYLLGIGTLLPWNFFITANNYFQYKFRNLDVNATMSALPQYMTGMQLTFENDTSIASSVANLVLQFINTLLVGRVSVRTRIISSLSLMIFMFGVTLVFVKIDTDSWQSGFFTTTMAMVVVISASSAVLQSSLFGLASTFPQRYTQAVMGGMGLGGVVAAVASIASIALGSAITDSAFIYFLVGVLAVVLGLIGYLILQGLNFAKHHDRSHNITVQLPEVTSGQPGSGQTLRGFRYYWNILTQMWVWGLSLFGIFAMTLSLYPSITSHISSVNPPKPNESPFSFTGIYFEPITCFLTFNVCDLIGRTLAAFWHIPKPSVTIPLFTCLRIVFVPLFLMCHMDTASNTLPYVFTSDAYPIGFMVVFALTNGYLSTEALMIAPRTVSSEYMEVCGTLMSLCMVLGLSTGSALSFLFVLLI